MIERNIIVYGLASSEDGRLRYIGQTVCGLKKRLYEHRYYAKKHKKFPVQKWICSVIDNGFDIIAWIIAPIAILHETEKETIAYYRDLGFDLLNLTDGGEGTIGFSCNKGRKRPDLSERNRQNKGKPGRKLSHEENEKLQVYRKMKKPYLVERNKNNHPWIGKKHKEETKLKMVEAWRRRNEKKEIHS